MSKHKQKSRDTPQTNRSAATVQIVNAFDWMLMAEDGYIPIYENAEVKMCVHQYADLISNMTIRLMENTEHGDNRVKNELSRKIDVNPCENMGRKQFVYWIVKVMMTVGDGNCVVYPEYEGTGYLKNLKPLKPSLLSFEETETSYRIRYGNVTLAPEEVLHFAMMPDAERPWLGCGWKLPLNKVVRSIVRADHTKNKLLESPAPSLVVKIDGLADQFSTPDGRKKLVKRYVSSQESGEPWIIPADMVDVTQVKPLTMQDLAIKENVELDRTKIARLLNVPAFTVGVGKYDDAEYNYFVNQPVRGMAMYIEQELTRKTLFNPLWHYQLNPRSLYNYKLDDLITAGKELVDRMALRRNEWRDWIGLSPDPEMDELLALENYIPADKLGEQNKLNGGDNG